MKCLIIFSIFQQFQSRIYQTDRMEINRLATNVYTLPFFWNDFVIQISYNLFITQVYM